MPFVIRQANDDVNPTLAGGVYGKYITAGRAVYYAFDGTQTRFILFIADGGKYGLDSVTSVEYKGAAIISSDWIFHRGTITSQIDPIAVSAGTASTDAFTSTAHGLINGDVIRFGVDNGVLPSPIVKTTKYYVVQKTDDTFKVSLTNAGTPIDLTTDSIGNLLCWKANTGFDDPAQGLPTFVSDVNTTFSNVAYIEGKLPASQSSATEPPDWFDFRILGTGRRLMDYDNTGAEVGIVSNDDELLANVALQIIDNLLVNYKVDPSRIDWLSWYALRNATNTDILQRPVETDLPIAGSGKWTGRYYYNNDFTNLIATRLDLAIDFNFGTSAPLSGMPSINYSIRWNGQIKPSYSESYTLTFNHGEGIAVYIDGQQVLNNPTPANDSLVLGFTAGTVYNIQVELTQAMGNAYCEFSWQSTSQPLQKVPAISQDIIDTNIVKRYECHTAFPTPVEASEVHERLMERVPGWDWTDDNGKITFLRPDRGIAFSFAFDAIDDDSRANFVKGQFEKQRRRINTRRNFQIFKYRNVQQVGYPVAYVQADRPQIRRFNSSIPTNEPAEDLGVSTRSLAERMAEMEMVLKADPKFTAKIAGWRNTSGLRKNQIVEISYYDFDGNFVVDEPFIITLHSWGAKNGQNNFELLPIAYPFYSDEPLVIVPEEAPTGLSASWNSGTSEATLTWTNNNAFGLNVIQRKLGGSTYETIATVPFSATSFVDTTIAFNGTYTYRVYNQHVLNSYSNEFSIVVSSLSAVGSPPTSLNLSQLNGVVTCNWTNNGGSGNNIIQRKLAGGDWSQVGSVAYNVATFDDTSITVTNTYYYRVYNANENGYSNEQSIYVNIGVSQGLPPSNFYVYENYYDLVFAQWTNNGATGNNILEVSDQYGNWTEIAQLPATDTTYSFTLGQSGYYTARISNSSVAGYAYYWFYYGYGYYQWYL